jgi:hypothetical protein
MTDQNEMPDVIWARNDEGCLLWSNEPQSAPNDSMPEARYIRADLIEDEGHEFIEVGYQYLFTDPMFGREVWRDRSSEWNGQRPKDSRKIYTHIHTGETNE